MADTKTVAPRRAMPQVGSADYQIRQIYLTVVITAVALWVALPFLTPIAWALVFAIALWPLYHRFLHRFPRHPTLAAVGFALATGLLVILPLSIAALSLAQESQNALDWLKNAQQHGIAAPGWLTGLPLVGTSASDWWKAHIASPQAANALFGSLSATSVMGWTRTIGSEVVKDFALFIMTLVVLATLLARGKNIAKDMAIISSRMFGEFGETFLGRMIEAVRATVNGTMLVSLLEGVTIGIGYVVAGVPQPLLFATFTIILALVPFGAWAAFGIASLILIGSGKVLGGVLLFAFGVTIMTVGDHIVQPSVIGSAVELPFILALIGAFGGLAAFGLVGLFIGPVIMAATLLVWQQWISSPVSATS